MRSNPNDPPVTYHIDISAVVVEPEPMGYGWQYVEGNRGMWSRGDSIDEAIGGLIRRLAVEHEGANYRHKVRQEVTVK